MVEFETGHTNVRFAAFRDCREFWLDREIEETCRGDHGYSTRSSCVLDRRAGRSRSLDSPQPGLGAAPPEDGDGPESGLRDWRVAGAVSGAGRRPDGVPTRKNPRGVE